MTKSPITCLALLALCCMLVVSGCKDEEKKLLEARLQTAQKELADARSQLESAEAKLETTEKERDTLKTKVTELSTSPQADEKLKAATAEAELLKDLLAQQTKERESTLGKLTESQNLVEQLQGRLAEQVKKVTGLQEQNAKLQQVIDELKKKATGALPVPEVKLP